MSASYRLHLSNGTEFAGYDERDPEGILAAIDDDDNFPDYDQDHPGWTWVAGLYVRRDLIVAFEAVPVPESLPRQEPADGAYED